MDIPRQRLFSDRQLTKLIVPLIVEQALAILVGLVDGVMVSVVGESEMSGVSLVNNFSNIILTLFAGLATGGAVLTSQFLGAAQKEKARYSAGQLITLSLGIGLVMLVLCLLFAKQILVMAFGEVEQAVMDAAVVYFCYNAVSFPFIALYNAGAAIFRSVGNSKISMKISLLKNAVNIAGNAICIYGLHMGVDGVAIPTLLSRIVGAVVILIPLFLPGQELRLKMDSMVKLQGKMMGKIFGVGLPNAFENSLFHLGRVIVLGMVTPFGTIHTAANAAASNIVGFALVIPGAMKLALVTVAGQCIGAHEIDQAKFYTKKLLIWTYVFQNIAIAVTFLLRWQIIGLYTSLSPETVRLTEQLICIHFAGAFLLYPLSFVLSSTLRAANDGTFIMLVSIVSMATLRVGLSWVLCTRLGWGVPGVWIAMVIDWVSRSAFFVARYLSGKWQKKCYLT